MSTTAITTPDARIDAPRRSAFAWPSVIETLLSLVAIAALLPLFAQFSGPDSAGGQRFADPPAMSEPLASRVDAQPEALARAKNDAMRALLADAGWQWAGWMAAGLVLIKLARAGMAPSLGAAVALATWAVAAWIGRVPWPLVHDRNLWLARAEPGWAAEPAGFVVALLALAAALLLVAAVSKAPAATMRQTLASRIGYPGFVVATGLGWLVLLDLSISGPPVNRYLALYHHGHLWLAMLTLGLCVFAKPALGRVVASLLSITGEIASLVLRATGPLMASIIAMTAILLAVAVIGLLLGGIRQVTSELGRLWLVIGIAWFFFMRGAPTAERLVRGRRAAVSLARYAWPLLVVAAVLVGAMLVTRDMGPLLIASYAAGAFLAASIAMWWHARSAAAVGPAVLAVLVFATWIVAVSVAVVELGSVHAVTAGRLENLAAPLASANDQLALITWFREAVPASGFGLGSVPWCGFAAASCAGVPAQIQSDYTFTALVGAFGLAAAWAITLGCAFWLHRLIRHHGSVTDGEPRFVATARTLTSQRQAFVSWVAVVWVVLTLCQLAVTVAGNLAVLPLTGVTYPFVSFGMTSLVVNCGFLAICLNLDLPGTAHG